MIKKGCAIAAVVLLGLFGGYLYLLWGKVETVPALILAGFGALGLVMVVSQLKAVIFGSGDAGALKRAEQGLPLEDGKEEAVWGPIEPLGAPLEAPFSGRPCVAYEYDAKNPSTVDSKGHERPGGSTLAGFALAPSVIRSNRGGVHLLGFSLLSEFPEKEMKDPGDFDRAIRYVGSTEFTEMGITKIGAMLSTMDDAMSDDDGSVRKDMRMKVSTAADFSACTLTEKVIAPGETVTAIGLWDAAKGGLVPKHRGKSVIVRLLPGGGAAMVAHSEKRPWGILAFALIWAGFAHAIIYFVLTKVPR
ncbi:MAG: hypothetical protein IPN03_20865 [Holophagales bacterium]|nr:hypothetical protein [Holophagales bacterium]